MKKGNFIQPSKRLQFGNVVSGGTTQRRRAQEGDKTYTKAVQVPSGARTDKSSRIVYDADGNRIGRRVAGSRPMYVPDKKNAGSLSKQGAENINRSRGRTKKEIAQGTPSNRDMPRGAQPAPRRQAQPDGPAAPSRPAPRRPAPAPARRPSPRMEKVQSRSAKPLDSTGPKKSLQVAKPAAKPGASSAPASSGNKRVDKIKARAEKRVNKIQDRRAKAGKRGAVKEARKAGRAMVKEAKGKPMKKRMAGGLGAAAALGGAAGSLMQNSDNPTMQKIGKGLSTASNVAGAVSGGLPGLAKKAAGAGAPAPAKYGKIKAKKGTLKEPTNAGLKKLPKNVRNKMGFKKAGGMKDRRKGGYGKKK